MSNKITNLKEQLRQEGKSTRAELGDEFHQQASERICDHIESWDVFNNAAVILTYLPMQGEVDLTSLLARHPQKVWGIPKTHGGGKMVFHQYDPEKLVRHKFGMLEPDPNCPEIISEEVQLVLVPGLAFDRNGWRLGYGGGFYDRYLSSIEGDFAGITYQSLILAQVPHENYDVKMSCVITEMEILPTG